MFEKSFSLIRTNPALSGNVKLVVSSGYKLYLESFRSNKALSASRFSHFELKDNEYYKEAVRYFFDGIESQSVFDVKNDNDKSDMHSDFQYQFDTSYYSGAFYSEDTWYKEEYEYLAPLHMKKNALPQGFVVLRVDGKGLVNSNGDVKNFRKEVVNQWKFVKLFDLTENSTLGTWMSKNFVNDDNMRNYPMIVNHEELRMSELFGINIKQGGWVTKYVNLQNTFAKNTPIFKTEEQFTQLWQDNDVLYPYLLNMKFLFDDTPATPEALRKYSINRYVGFYIDQMQRVSSVSPYKGFELNKVNPSQIRTLSAVECSEIPFVKDNLFVREVAGTLYSFDPIKNGWVDAYVYWIEFNGTLYKVQRVDNYARSGIYGEWLYKIVANISIVHDISPTGGSLFDGFEQRVLINELSTFANRIIIQPELKINEVVAKNIVSYAASTASRLVKVYENVNVNGTEQMMFRLDVRSNNSNFSIPGFNDADLFLMQVGDDHFVVKKYDESLPGLGGMYYLQSDWAVKADDSVFEYWINNGNQTKVPEYFKQHVLAQPTNPEYEPLQCVIYKIEFTEIKDFDFDRVETSFARYEYEKDNEVTQTLEPKLYAKEYRTIEIKVNILESERVQRTAIMDANKRKYNVRAFNGDMNPLTDKAYTPEELYERDLDGSWHLTESETAARLRKRTLVIPRKFYREEKYILRLEDGDKEVDFKSHSLSDNLINSLTWGTDKIAELSDLKSDFPELKGVLDPNEKLDYNYVPVSSEYIQSDELWEIRSNQQLSPIWDKNQSVCKWGVVNSTCNNDLPYRLNYSLDAGGLYNNVPNIYSGKDYPVRKNRDLDYFYRFGLQNAQDYAHYSLHLRDVSFDIDQYLSANYDYFSSIFRTDQVTSKGIVLTNKYSMFISDNVYEYPYTVFKGVKYQIHGVDRVVYDMEEYSENGRVIIDEVVPKMEQKYIDYKFSVVFARKRSVSANNSGDADNNLGMDIYINERWKNVLIHLYIDTDEIVEILNPVSGEYVNIETCPIDVWYNDNQISSDVDEQKWLECEFRVNGLGIDLRPRDLMLNKILSVLTNVNYEPIDRNKNKLNFIHVYENGEFQKMSRVTTDVTLDVVLPTGFAILEKTYRVTPMTPSVDLKINNTLKNRIIRGVNAYSVDGLRVDSLSDINAYNDYAISKTFNDLSGDFNYWDIKNGEAPLIYRHSGAYAPIFKTVPLFKPQRSFSKTVGMAGNWKFYDEAVNNQHLLGFGMVDEIIFSKCNTSGNVLKIQDATQKDKSIYPMVDEYGYDFDSRFIFSSSWESDYYYTSRRIEIEPNQYPTPAGYTLVFNGETDYLRVPDAEKFNLERYLVDDVNYRNYTKTKPWLATNASMREPATRTMEIETGYDIPPPEMLKEFGGYFKTITDISDILIHPIKSTNVTSLNGIAAQMGTALGTSFVASTTNAPNPKLVITNANTNFEFEPEYYTNINNGGKIVYYGMKTGGSDANKKAKITVKIYWTYSNLVAFAIKPANGVLQTVSISTIDTAGDRISESAFLTLVATTLVLYNVTPTPQNAGYVVLEIERKVAGYFNNFNIIPSDNITEIVGTDLAELERMYFDVFNKTQLKLPSERITGYLNEITVEFWVMFSKINKRFETVLYKGDTTDLDVWKDPTFQDFSYVIGTNDKSNNIAFKTCHKNLNGTKKTHTLISRSALVSETWYHIACVSDSSKCSKQIYINGALDITVKDFLGAKLLPTERELVALFLTNRSRFLPGIVFDRIGSESALADRIRNRPADVLASRWYDLIRSYRPFTLEDETDLQWQRANWKATLPQAYKVFKTTFYNYDYYLNADKNYTWDILIGTDAVVRLGSRTFAGSLDELRIWSSARTAQQIRENYRFISRMESHLDPFSTLVACYRFDEGMGASVIKDLMGGHMIKTQTRWEHIRSEKTNDGTGVKIKDENKSYVFENDFFTGADINVALQKKQWVLSGADILGYSDERYPIEIPPIMRTAVAQVSAVISTKLLLESLEAAKTEAFVLPETDTKTSFTKPAATSPISNEIRLHKPVSNDFLTTVALVTNDSDVMIHVKEPVLVGDVIISEQLPTINRDYAVESGVVSTSAAIENPDIMETGNPVHRADTRISSSGDDRGSNILRKLWTLITKRKDQ